MTKHIDSLVIGGGCVGICSAFFLAERGRQVTVVDQGQIGAGCSYGSAGLIARSHGIPLAAPGVLLKVLRWMFDSESPFYIKPRLNLALFSWLWRFAAACRKAPMLRGISLLNNLSQASLALYKEFASLDGLEFHFKHKGSLLIYKNPNSFEAGVREAELLKQYGITFKVLDQAGVRQLEPKIRRGILGGIYCPDDAHLNPSEFVRVLASRAKIKGVSLLPSTEVLGFETSGRRVSTVRTTRGDFEADQVVLAAGSWSPGLASDLRLALPIQPAKGYSVTVKCSERDDSIPVTLSEMKVMVTPMGGILRFSGTLELAGLDLSINLRRVRAIRRAVGEYLVGTDEYELLEIWRGLRPCTPDGLPIIGISATWKNLIIATGHGMQGLALGPITGKLVAQLMCKETPSLDVVGLGEERFRLKRPDITSYPIPLRQRLASARVLRP